MGDLSTTVQSQFSDGDDAVSLAGQVPWYCTTQEDPFECNPACHYEDFDPSKVACQASDAKTELFNGIEDTTESAGDYLASAFKALSSLIDGFLSDSSKEAQAKK